MKNFLNELFFWFFKNYSFLHPKGNAHKAVTRNVAKFVNFPLLSCVVDQVTWFKKLNALKNNVIWIPIVTALQISCSWQPPLCFTTPRCCSRWCKIWVFSTFVNGNTYQLRDWAIWEQKIVLFYERYLQFLNSWYEFLHSAKIGVVANFF